MDGMGHEFLLHSQNKGGVVGRPLPIKRESRFSSFIPGHQHHLVYTRGSISSCLYQGVDIFRLYQVINVLLFVLGHHHFPFIPGHQAIPCLYQGKRAIHTSGHDVVSASWAGILPTSSSWAVCASGAWEIAIHASGMILGSEYSPAVQSLGCPRPWEAVQHG